MSLRNPTPPAITPATMASILSFPDEILLQILCKLPAASLLACGATCKRFQRVTDQSIWRQRCLDDFRYWDRRHRVQELTNKPVSEVDWRDLYIGRRNVDRQAQQAIDGLIASQIGRTGRVDAVIPFGDDIKECLLRNINAPETDPELLARRWFSRAVLGRLQRERAIQTWISLANGGKTSLLEALLAFDVFVRCEKSPDITEVLTPSDLLARH